MNRTQREFRFLVPAFAVLFAGLALLAIFLIAEESQRAQGRERTAAPWGWR